MISMYIVLQVATKSTEKEYIISKLINEKTNDKNNQLKRREERKEKQKSWDTQNNMVDFKQNILVFMLNINALNSPMKVQYCQIVF